MVAAAEIGTEVHAVAKAVGLLDEHDSVNLDWFGSPLTNLRHLLTRSAQRAAFMDALDLLAPHDDATGAPAGDTWHAIVGGTDHPNGRLYLTAHPLPNGAVIGVAGVLQSGATSGLPSASLRLEVPLFKATDDPQPNGSFTAATGQADAPLVAELRLELNWVRGQSGQPITLKAVTARAELMPAASSDPKDKLSIVFEQLDLDGSGPKDTPLDPHALDSQAMRLVMGLLQSELHGTDNVVQHVLGLLGLSPNMPSLPASLPTVPAFPLDFFTQGPAALRSWLASLVTVSGGDAPVRAWLYYLA